jgi:hypothetical protein
VSRRGFEPTLFHLRTAPLATRPWDRGVPPSGNRPRRKKEYGCECRAQTFRENITRISSIWHVKERRIRWKWYHWRSRRWLILRSPYPKQQLKLQTNWFIASIEMTLSHSRKSKMSGFEVLIVGGIIFLNEWRNLTFQHNGEYYSACGMSGERLIITRISMTPRVCV